MTELFVLISLNKRGLRRLRMMAMIVNIKGEDELEEEDEAALEQEKVEPEEEENEESKRCEFDITIRRQI